MVVMKCCNTLGFALKLHMEYHRVWHHRTLSYVQKCSSRISCQHINEGSRAAINATGTGTDSAKARQAWISRKPTDDAPNP